MEAKDHLAIAKMLYAMEQKRKKPDMSDARYQRTMTDEYPWCTTPQPGLRSVSPEQKDIWRKLHDR